MRKQEQLNSREQKLATSRRKRCLQINTVNQFAGEFKQLIETQKGNLLQE